MIKQLFKAFNGTIGMNALGRDNTQTESLIIHSQCVHSVVQFKIFSFCSHPNIKIIQGDTRLHTFHP